MLNDPLPLNLTKVAALRIIREVARDSVRVVFLTHARKQMQKRKITNTQVGVPAAWQH
jgi:predicted translin family RNA/ssDNA-binding protein